MIVDRTASAVRLKVFLRDDAGVPITGVAHDDSDLVVEVWGPDEDDWETQTLVSGTLGAYGPNHWVEVGEGLYEYGFPPGYSRAGRRTDLRIQYASNRPQFDALSFLTSPPVGQATLQIGGPGAVVTLGLGTTIFIKEREIPLVFVSTEDLEAVEVEIVFELPGGPDVAVIDDSELTKTGTTITVEAPDILTAETRSLNWAVRVKDNQRVLGSGSIPVAYAPYKDSLDA